MKEFDIIVIGAGSGMIIVDKALEAGMSVALVEKGKLGGTCLNVGCIPSKLLLTPADKIIEFENYKKMGINCTVKSANFSLIMEKTRQRVREWRKHSEIAVRNDNNLSFYSGEAKFVGEREIEVNGSRIKGKKIVIAAGTRPAMPKEWEKNKIYTSDTIFNLQKKPKSIIILGGGYIGCEFAHFFSAMGVDVKVVERGKHLVDHEDEEASKMLEKEFSKRMELFLENEVKNIENKTVTINKRKIRGDIILAALGRRSNADLLNVKESKIKCDEKNFIKVNDYFETSCKGIYAFGDILGSHMFKHSANKEALVVWDNICGRKRNMNFIAEPHAVFTSPQIAGVGLTENGARKKHSVKVGFVEYKKTAKGVALEADGFCKVIVDNKTRKILGCTICGPEASILIQEVVLAIQLGITIDKYLETMHIHPALSEVVMKAMERTITS